MPKTSMFCQECGHENSYSSKKPNFCETCGNKFPHATVARKQTLQPVIEDEEIEEIEETEEVAKSDFKFNLSIDGSGPRTVGDLFSEGKSMGKTAPKDDVRGRGNVTKSSLKKKIKNLFEKDIGTK